MHQESEMKSFKAATPWETEDFATVNANAERFIHANQVQKILRQSLDTEDNNIF